jgi:hypothetical protein
MFTNANWDGETFGESAQKEKQNVKTNKIPKGKQ